MQLVRLQMLQGERFESPLQNEASVIVEPCTLENKFVDLDLFLFMRLSIRTVVLDKCYLRDITIRITFNLYVVSILKLCEELTMCRFADWHSCHCGKHYSELRNLRRHQKYECGKQPCLRCNLCDYACYRKNVLRMHYWRKHQTKF